MKKLLILWIFVLVIGIVNAEDFYYKIDKSTNITSPCFNSNALCSNNTICTITITDPNNDIVVNNQNMTYGVVAHSYEYMPLLFGKYDVTTYCIDGSDTGYGAFNFQSNNIGRQITNFGVYTFIFFILFGVSIIVLYILTKTVSPMMYAQALLTSLLGMILAFYLYMNTLIFNSIFLFVWRFSMLLFGVMFFLNLWFYGIALVSTWGKSGKNKKHFNDKF